MRPTRFIALLRWTHRLIAPDEHPCRRTDNSAPANSDCPGRVEDAPPCGRSGPSCSSLFLFLFLIVVLRLRIVSSGLLTLRQCGGGPGVIADGQVALSRRDLDRAIHVSDFKFGPNTSGR